MEPDQAAVVKAFLAAMEARDLTSAEALTGPDFEMVFPGGARFTTLAALVEWAKPRYHWVKKRLERFDCAPAPDGIAVTCFGTLYGEWPNGAAFEGIRFVDWFLVRDGKLVKQYVWNDMGEARAAG
ncbi:MAG: nuclear transport factor 2 family protein [Alphaproteobacteria bacterium]|nr:nuclear transport factor 2 family protein [Alphaproteobacteria bacterium]